MRMAKEFPARFFSFVAIVGLALSFTTGCNLTGGSGSSDNTPTAEVEVQPSNAEIRAGATVQFSASVTGTKNQSVTWSVSGVVGGNSTVGTVDANGLYKAPTTAPNPNSVQVEATSVAVKKASGASAVTIENPIPILLSITPTNVPVGSFTISLAGKNFVNGAVVVFGSKFLTTTFVSATQVTATGAQSTPVPSGVQITVLNPDPGSMASNSLLLPIGSGAGAVNANAASRFLEHASWGPTPQTMAHVQQVGFQTYLNEQFNVAKSVYPAPPQDADMSFLQQHFFVQALTGQDQLRQRVAFALSQIMVASANKINRPDAFVLWQNMMQNDAFGNFSTLLKDVTLSPVMGNYLDMVNNDKPDPARGINPNENFAREILQLFSIGLNQLNPDGTPQVDGSGVPLDTYNQDAIIGFAHVFTGWTYPTKPGSSARFPNSEYYGGPMIPFDSHHDTDPKLLLNGATLPGGGTTQADLDAALQNIFNHPNVGPFICKQLIQHLVTSNPSPAYVQRVVSVFNNNGSGVRGDLKAVVTAILLDGEARRGDDPTQAQAQDGHLKEPVLFMMNLLRALNTTADGKDLAGHAADMKQEPMFSPTVFNFYHPTYMIPGTNLSGPEFEIHNSTTAISRIDFVNTLVYGSINDKTTTNISNFVSLASNPGQMLDAMSAALLHGNMSANMRNTLLTTVNGIPDNTRRARAALYLIGSSSQFQVSH